MAAAVRRVVLLDRACKALGGAAKLAELWGISRRAVNYRLASDYSTDDVDLELAADALDRRAAELRQLADGLRDLTARE